MNEIFIVMGKNDFIATNDYNGNEVVCSKGQWYSHIVKNHNIMYKNSDAVEDAITTPDIVYNSDQYDDRKVFFKSSDIATYGKKFKTKVIVEYDSDNNGEVVTAFPVKEIKGGISDVVFESKN